MRYEWRDVKVRDGGRLKQARLIGKTRSALIATVHYNLGRARGSTGDEFVACVMLFDSKANFKGPTEEDCVAQADTLIKHLIEEFS